VPLDGNRSAIRRQTLARFQGRAGWGDLRVCRCSREPVRYPRCRARHPRVATSWRASNHLWRLYAKWSKRAPPRVVSISTCTSQPTAHVIRHRQAHQEPHLPERCHRSAGVSQAHAHRHALTRTMSPGHAARAASTPLRARVPAGIHQRLCGCD